MKELLSGVFYLENAIPQDIQNKVAKWFEENRHLFYHPVHKSGFKMSAKMLCLGKHWSAQDNKYHDKRVDHDQMTVQKVPDWLSDFGNALVQEIYPHQRGGLDLAIANVYAGEARLGMHRDNAESKESISTGFPVVSLSFGLPAEFHFQKGKEMLSINIKHSDIICFGDQNRLMYHGISSVASKPSVPEFENIRLNITLRRY